MSVLLFEVSYFNKDNKQLHVVTVQTLQSVATTTTGSVHTVLLIGPQKQQFKVPALIQTARESAFGKFYFTG